MFLIEDSPPHTQARQIEYRVLLSQECGIWVDSTCYKFIDSFFHCFPLDCERVSTKWTRF